MQELLKYPFLSSARQALEGGKSELGAEQFEKAVARAVDSVALAASKPSQEASRERIFLGVSPVQAAEIFTASRLLVSLLDSEYYQNAFARGEALSARESLSKEGAGELVKITRDFFPSLNLLPEKNVFTASLFDFLSHGDGLSKRELAGGTVFLSREAALHLFEKSVFNKLRKRLPVQGLPPLFKEYALEMRNRLPTPAARSEYTGKYLSLPCIEWILKGVPEGRRYYASMALATACRKDGLTREGAAQVMQRFVDSCGSSAHPFTSREAFASLDWVYRRNPRFSCKWHREHGLGPEGRGYPCVEAMRGKTRPMPAK